MTVAPAPDSDDLVYGIAALEGRIQALVGWAQAVLDLGDCCHNVSTDGLAVIGKAMLDDAVNAKKKWQECFALVCDLHGGDRRQRQTASHPPVSNMYPDAADPEEAGR